MIFQPKLGKWTLFLTFFIVFCFVVIVTLPALYEEQLSNTGRIVLLAIGFFVIAFFVWYMLASTKYILDKTHLVVKGRLKVAHVPYAGIFLMFPTRSNTRRDFFSTNRQAIAIFAVHEEAFGQLEFVTELADKYGETVPQYLTRYVMHPEQESAFLAEGFQPVILQLVVISPAEIERFQNELISRSQWQK